MVYQDVMYCLIFSLALMQFALENVEEAIRYGYLMKRNGSLYLHFVSSSNAGSGRALCENDTGYPNGKIDTNSQADSSSNLTAVYVIIPLLLIIIAAVVVFFVWRKRKQNQAMDEDPKYASSKDKTMRTSPETSNAIANRACEDDFTNSTSANNQSHGYLISEPVNEYASIQDSNLADTKENDYDITNTTTDNVNKTDNVYNTLTDASEDTYNHIGKASDNTEHNAKFGPTKGFKILGDNDTFNHVGENNGEFDYDTSETLISKKRIETSNDRYSKSNSIEDTFNHTGNGNVKQTNNPFTTGKTSSNQEDDYSHTNAKPDVKKTVQKENTYEVIPPTGGHTPSTFRIEQLPDAGDYELAKELPVYGDHALAKGPLASGGYELAKGPLMSGGYELAKGPSVIGDYELAKQLPATMDYELAKAPRK